MTPRLDSLATDLLPVVDSLNCVCWTTSQSSAVLLSVDLTVSMMSCSAEDNVVLVVLVVLQNYSAFCFKSWDSRPCLVNTLKFRVCIIVYYLIVRNVLFYFSENNSYSLLQHCVTVVVIIYLQLIWPFRAPPVGTKRQQTDFRLWPQTKWVMLMSCSHWASLNRKATYQPSCEMEAILLTWRVRADYIYDTL